MNRYRQLTSEERHTLSTLRKQGYRNLSTTMGHSWGLIRERFPVWRGMGWED